MKKFFFLLHTVEVNIKKFWYEEFYSIGLCQTNCYGGKKKVMTKRNHCKEMNFSSPCLYLTQILIVICLAPLAYVFGCLQGQQIMKLPKKPA